MQLNLAFAQVDGDFPEATFEGESGIEPRARWPVGLPRQFKDFEEYLLRRKRFAELRDAQALPVSNRG